VDGLRDRSIKHNSEDKIFGRTRAASRVPPVRGNASMALSRVVTWVVIFAMSASMAATSRFTANASPTAAAERIVKQRKIWTIFARKIVHWVTVGTHSQPQLLYHSVHGPRTRVTHQNPRIGSILSGTMRNGATDRSPVDENPQKAVVPLPQQPKTRCSSWLYKVLRGTSAAIGKKTSTGSGETPNCVVRLLDHRQVEQNHAAFWLRCTAENGEMRGRHNGEYGDSDLVMRGTRKTHATQFFLVSR
jgi:hypothetical protein